ncbi:PTS transporter subunit IIC [Alkalicoccobacillus plakortidis]|uniref:PTS sugar transporter subunit IIC n=1 Tax=Alkalicoccobacillus plakortidis TaxID=444060 RepID=A0ABT0XJE3_9BACI|nr:PTS sugar transporter subunit IIC [Alkalicoccobacillus plakortidis]MCM2675329.1 PTS sugar transporter subunit IIC [Alkalicoccobacillus plakortidis]
MNAFLKKKGVHIHWRVYLIDAMGQMAIGFFATLIIGLIISTAGEQFGFPSFIRVGELAMGMMGPAIGAAVALGLKAPRLVVLSAVVAGAAGAEFGGVSGSFVASVIAVELGKLISGETKMDIILVPLVTVVSGYLTAMFAGPGVQTTMTTLGKAMMWAGEQQPFLMCILVAILMGLVITGPTSSAALAMVLELEGPIAGAATIGCAAQMVGFALSGYRDNGFSGLIPLGMGTSMLQLPNVVKKPIIIIPPLLAGAILAPIGVIMFGITNIPAGAGMGTSGLVGPIMTFRDMGFTTSSVTAVLLFYFIAPALLSLLFSESMRKMGYIRDGDMKIYTLSKES